MAFSFFKQIQRYGAEHFAALLFGLAFVVSVFPVFDMSFLTLGFVVSALVLVLLNQLCDRAERPALTAQGRWIAGLVFALFGLGLVSVLLSDMPYDGVLPLAVLSVLPLSFVVTLRFWGRAFLRPMMGVVLGGFALLCALTIYQYFMLGADNTAFVTWPLGSSAAMAAVLSCGFLLVFGLFLRASSPLYRAVYGVMLVVAFLSVLMTGSVAGLAGLVAALAFVGVALSAQIKRSGLVLIAVLLLCCVAGALLVVLTDVADGVLQDAYAVKGWSAALNIALDYPLFGTGLGSFIYYYPGYKLPGDQFSGFSARNDMLQMVAELGFLLPLIMYGLAGAICVYSARALSVIKAQDPRRLQLVIYGGVLLALFIQLHGDGAFYTLAVLMIMGLMLAAWLCVVMEVLATDSASMPRRVLPDGVRMGLAFGLVLTVTFLAAQIGGQIYVERASRDMVANDLGAVAVHVNAADRFAQGTNVSAIVMAANVHIGQLETQRGNVSFSERQAMVHEATQLLQRAEVLNPRLPSVPFSYALLARYGADVVPAEFVESVYLRKVLSLNPEYIAARLRLAELLRGQGDLREGLELLVAGLDLVYPDQNPLYYYASLVQAAEVMGDEASSRRAEDKFVASQQQQVRNAERDIALGRLLDRVRFW